MIKKLFKKQISFFSILSIAVFAMFFVISPNTVNAGSISLPPNNLGLVGYWSFEDATSTTATDFSGNGNTGTLTNMDSTTDWVNGRIGTALDFDGTDDYVDLGEGTLVGNTWSISTWIRPDDVATDGDRIFVLRPTSGDANEVRLHFSSSKIDIIVIDSSGSGTGYKDYQGATTLSTGVWQHVAATWDGTNLEIYLDGQSDTPYNKVTDNSITQTNTSRKRQIGQSTLDSAYFDGRMDDVRIYNRALSATEVYTLYNNTKATRIQSGVSNTDLLGYWSFEDATGTKATDFSGNGNTGTLTNMTNDDWVDGKKGIALDFDGVDDYVDAGLGIGSEITTGTTFSAWVYTRSTGGQIILSDYDSDTGNPSRNQYGWQFRIIDNGILFSYNDFWGNTYAGRKTTGDEIQTNTWHYVVGTWDGTTGSSSGFKIYIDGIRTDDVNNELDVESWVSTGISSTPMMVGRTSHSTGPTLYFNGSIDDVRIYSRALSGAEIQNLYNQSKATYINTSQNNKLTDGLVGLWSFNGQDLDGTTAFDRSGNGNNGTLTNGPQPAAGKIGQALSFDGSDDYINLPSSLDNALSSGVSFSAWINPNSIASYNTILSSYYSTLSSEGRDGFVLRTNTDNIEFFLYDSGNYIGKTTIGSNISVGDWYHIVGIWDGAFSSSGMSIYINGAEISSTISESLPVDSFDTTSIPFAIGFQDTGGDDDVSTGINFNGKIDEVRIYNRVLTTNEIKQLYSQGR